MNRLVVIGVGLGALVLAGGGGVAAFLYVPALGGRFAPVKKDAAQQTAASHAPSKPGQAGPEAGKPEAGHGAEPGKPEAAPGAAAGAAAEVKPATVPASSPTGMPGGPAPAAATTVAQPNAVAGVPAATGTSPGDAKAGDAAASKAAPAAGSAEGARSPADAATDRNGAHLVRLYEGMRPKDAAGIIAQLEPELGTKILLGMKERQASKVLGLLPPQKAADLTARIAKVKDAR